MQPKLYWFCTKYGKYWCPKKNQKSSSNCGLRYLAYYGDGDNKSFQAVENVYEGKQVIKYECIGHYQKRVGNRLRKLRLRIKGLGGEGKRKKIDSDVQKKDGMVVKSKQIAKSRLIDALIYRLQNYFGIALRSNAESVPELKRTLLASMFHVASSRGENYHTYCSQTSDS